MQPIILSLQAFGPFSGAECVDFRRLGERPLFLINGATGSGKTTLLDAICFALYGKTTGNEREGAQMRSDHADESLLTEVCFTFRVHQTHYKIRRIPEQNRPKARGEGVVKQAPEAQLWRLNDQLEEEAVLVASKVTDATREIEALLNLNADQFRQVMVLPQGKFRQLLMADSKEREQIFSQLFQTQIYKRIEEALKNQSLKIQREAEDLTRQKLAWLKQANVESPEQLQSIFTQVQTELSAAEKARKALQTRVAQLEQALQNATLLQAKFRQLDECRQKQLAFTAQHEEIVQKQQRILLWNATERLSPYYQQWNKLKQQHQSITAEVAERVTQLKNIQARYDQAKAQAETLPQLEQKKLEIIHKVNELERLNKAVSELVVLQQQLDTVDLQWRTASQHLEQHVAAHQHATSQLQALEQQREQLRQSLDDESNAQLKLKSLQEIQEQYRRLQHIQQAASDTQNELHACKQKGLALKEQLEAARHSYYTIERDWHLAQAAVLARELNDNQPCPVCGSLEHPALAQEAANTPTEAERSAALAAFQRVSNAHTEEQANYRHISNKQRELSRDLSEQHVLLGDYANQTPAQLQAELEAARTGVEAFKLTRHQLADVTQAIATAAEQKTRAESEKEKSQSLLRELELDKAKRQSTITRLQSELPEHYRVADRLAQDIDEAKTSLDRTSHDIIKIQQLYDEAGRSLERTQVQLQESQRQADALAQECQQKQAFWEDQLRTEQLDEAAFLSLRDSSAEKSAYQHAVAEYERAVQHNEGALALLVAELHDKTVPDLAALQDQHNTEDAQLRTADNHWQAVQSRFVELNRVSESLAQLAEQSKELDKAYAKVGTLSLAANGQTESRLSLQRFVLSVLLDDVLLEASRRMYLMSRGRYRLVRKEDRAKGNRASGLELEVDDAFTGRVRPVATLSGGESFIAALSLALGLSDVVQAYAGGVRLDTLFIDEGFGSLDPESLDLAVRTLMDLQDAGRTVGVISHVTELKEQIPLRIDIAASQGGSKIRWQA